jgi:hypothetical protein
MQKRFRHFRFTHLLLILMLFAVAFRLGSATAEAADNGYPAVLDKENPNIRAVMAIQDHHSPALFSLPDVVGTATGLDDQGNPAVLVFTKGPGAAGIPARLEGVPVVVKMTGEFYALRGGKVSTTGIFTPPVPIGVSTGNQGECSAGTIGARVTDGASYYALSNNHVYALENEAAGNSWVLQPGRYDTQCFATGSIIGQLAAYVPINFGSGDNIVDAAIARVSRDSQNNLMVGKATPSNGYGTPKSTTAAPVIGSAVKKYGRTTQQTTGTITGINAAIAVNYGASGIATFTGQIIVQSGKPFLKAGDSGSLLVTGSGLNPVGLLFAGDSTGKFAVANDIDDVLSSLSGLTGTMLRIDGN